MTIIELGPQRERKRVSSMRRVQARALDLFEQRGFDGVTIDEIAQAAEVSAPTVYRHFGSKEQIVLWDDYDPQLFAAISAPDPPDSLLDALVEQIGQAVDAVSADDASRILRRSRLIYREAALREANTAALARMRDGLAAALLSSGACTNEFDARVVAGAVSFALEAAVGRWEAAAGRTPLGALVRDALSRLSRLTERPKTTPGSAVGRCEPQARHRRYE